MEIVRNKKGEIPFKIAKEIIDLCLDNQILFGAKEEFVFAYHKAGETSPEGWYKDEYFWFVQEFQNTTDTDLNLFIDALKEKGINYQPSRERNSIPLEETKNIELSMYEYII